MANPRAPVLTTRRIVAKKEDESRDTGTNDPIIPAGIQEATITPTQANIPDNRHTTNRQRNYTSWPGVKTSTWVFTVPLSDRSVEDLGEFLKSSLGAEMSTATLTLDPLGAHTNAIIFALNANTPAQIIQIEGSDGVIYYRPVKAFDVGLKRIDLAIALPAGVLPVAIANPAQTGGQGGGWYEDPTAPTVSFELQGDRGGQSNETKILSKVCVPTISLVFDLVGRVALNFSFQGAEWIPGSAPDVEDSSKTVEQYLSFQGVLFKQPLSPVVPPVVKRLRGLTLPLSPEYIPIPGQTGTDEGASDPESDLLAWERGRAFASQGVTLQYSTPEGDTRYTERQNFPQSKEQGFLFFRAKTGGGLLDPSGTFCIWLPELTPDDNPQKVASGGIEAEDNLYTIDESENLVGQFLTKCAVAFFRQ